MQARLDGAYHLAETEHDALLVRIHTEERRIGKKAKKHEADKEDGAGAAACRGRAHAAAGAARTAKYLPQLFLRAPQQLVEIRRLISAATTAAARSLTPGATVATASTAALPAATAVIIVPGHQKSFDCEGMDLLETHTPGFI
jgi:hypothetical protein